MWLLWMTFEWDTCQFAMDANNDVEKAESRRCWEIFARGICSDHGWPTVAHGDPETEVGWMRMKTGRVNVNGHGNRSMSVGSRSELNSRRRLVTLQRAFDVEWISGCVDTIDML
jgi:hypothetical protein